MELKREIIETAELLLNLLENCEDEEFLGLCHYCCLE